ncbi:MAG: hypothetical protein OEM82_04735, partial [Acidobacteriota bacterium]|nr:hypothetical protein [Acidobacteriota bacterium]
MSERSLKILLIVSVCVALGHAQGGNSFDLERIRENRKEPVEVARFESSPVIDGLLNDEVWQKAAQFTDFVQTEPGNLVAPSRETIAYMGYDE